MNVMFTEICNLKCPYCFAYDELYFPKKNNKELFLSKDNFDYILKFLIKSKYSFLSIIGGEPTLHPHFVSFCDSAINSGLGIRLFTNGLYNEDISNYLLSISHSIQSILVNLNERETYSEIQYNRVIQNLKKLGRKASLSFNLYHDNHSISDHLRVTRECDNLPIIRLGITQPIPSQNNCYLPDNLFKTIAQKIVEFSIEGIKNDIRIGFDCGFERCHFTNEEIKFLHLNKVNTFFRCDPAIDVNLKLDVMSCFPLCNTIRFNLKEFDSLKELRETMFSSLNELRDKNISNKCKECLQFTYGLCKGGCTSRLICRNDKH